MSLDPTLPEEVRTFCLAVYANARQVWEREEFVQGLLDIERHEDGSITVCDNYEKFFNLIFVYTVDGKWRLRFMYSDEPEREYTFQQAMSDASILYTG